MKVKILKVEKNDLTQKFVTLIFCHVCLDERNEVSERGFNRQFRSNIFSALYTVLEYY